MTVKDAQLSPTAQGASASHVGFTPDLYETRHGLFAGPRTHWDGGEAPLPQPAPSPQLPAPDVGEQIARGLQNLISRIRELEGAQPAQGSLTLTPEQAGQWQAYQQLGPDPAALGSRLRDGDTAREREQARTLAAVGRADPTVLADRLRASGLTAQIRDVPAVAATPTTAAQPARQEVRVLNAEGQDVGELREYAGQHWPAYAPSLFPQTTPPQGGTVVSPQAGGGQAPHPAAGSVAKRVLNGAASHLNPKEG